MNIWSRKIKLWLKSSSEISGGSQAPLDPTQPEALCAAFPGEGYAGAPGLAVDPCGHQMYIWLQAMVYSFFRHKIMYHVLFCIYVWYDMCTDFTNLYCNSTTLPVQYLSAPYHMCIIYVRWLSGADMYLTQDCFSHMRRHTPSGSLPPSPCSPVPQIHWYADYY